MKKRKIIAFTLIFLSIITSFSNLNISGSVIGSQGTKGIIGFILLALGLLILLDERLEKKILEEDQIPQGTFPMSIGFSWNGYKFSAYPGPEVVGDFRREHLPYHCHIEIHGKTAYKVIVKGEDITEITGKNLPPNLKRYIKENSKEIERKIKTIFHGENFIKYEAP